MMGGILDYQFPQEWGPRYDYKLRCTLEGDARLRGLAIINDLHMAPLVMPDMAVGENAFVYTDDSPGERQVRITHEWVERSASAPPEAPPAPVFPADGGETDGTDIRFEWPVPADPDGDAVVDYHWELSDRPDMRWPLSTNFEKLISLTADRGRAQYTLTYVGMLTPDTRYYWHVRAKDAKGVWSPWSETWSFTPRGAAPPVDVTMDFDAGRGAGALHWQPNPVGRRPVRYRVYGSDEKGFSVSDEEYAVNVGERKASPVSSPFAANFVAETADAELAVVGASLGLPNANKAYYRVVAVDENGNRSWSSDYAEAPRPFIFGEPVAAAQVGRAYRCRLGTIRSIGDLRMRAVDGAQVTGFWDLEEPRFALDQGPVWLKIDAATGLLSGTPDAAGEARVVVTATLRREVLQLNPDSLAWGQHQVTGTETKTLGPARLEFTIDVQP
jgi:hypothetical protein